MDLHAMLNSEENALALGASDNSNFAGGYNQDDQYNVATEFQEWELMSDIGAFSAHTFQDWTHSVGTDQALNFDVAPGVGDAIDGLCAWGGQILDLPSEPQGTESHTNDSGSGSPTDSTADEDIPMTNVGADQAQDTETGLFVSSSQSSPPDDLGKQVCFGRVVVDVKLQGVLNTIPAKIDKYSGTTAEHILPLKLKGRDDFFTVNFDDDEIYGTMRDKDCKVFKKLKDSRELHLTFEPIISKLDLKDVIEKVHKAKDAITHVDVNIYGPETNSDRVGKLLSDEKMWIQQPSHRKTDIPYQNPHILSIPGMTEEVAQHDMARTSKPARNQGEHERLQQTVAQVEDAAQRRANALVGVQGDQRLQSALYDHQQKALSFMLQRENGDIPEEFRLWRRTQIGSDEMFVHQITQSRSPRQPEEKGGGILADEMGLGKTLSILSLVLETTEPSHKWAHEHRQSGYEGSRIKGYSRATLVIVPSGLLIENWRKEINRHIDGSLKIVKYHGPQRNKSLNKLPEADLVLTTYNTLKLEFSQKRSKLHQIAWYRLVLDEGHIIRRMATGFFKSCQELEARSRWCLTGTPIQNRLEDIGALFVFLRAEPFTSMAYFRKYVVTPYLEKDEQKVRERLILLYESLCLRRTTSILNLPGREDRLRELRFSPQERKQYEQTKKALDRQIREQVNNHVMGKKFGLFQAHLQLRIFCNHGTYQKQFSWHRREKNKCTPEALEAWDLDFGYDAQLQCSVCHTPRALTGGSLHQNKFDQHCKHRFCDECFQLVEEEGSRLLNQKCPLCQKLVKSFETGQKISTRDGDGDVAMSGVDDLRKEDGKSYFMDSGTSTKIQTLVKDIEDGLDETKSIVFSCWTRTLDLIEKHLEIKNIRYFRIDGDTSVAKRQSLLDLFEASSHDRVLLMTTGTGAFGLNLAVANRVFVTELQWNPSVENQAIARAIRLNQTRKVTVTRYVMLESVEVEMRAQQELKRKAAKAGFKADEHHESS